MNVCISAHMHPPPSPHPAPGVCLKGRALWGQTQSGYKAVGAHCKIGWGAVTGGWKSGGGGIGVVDVPSGRVEGGALGGGVPPSPQAKPFPALPLRICASRFAPQESLAPNRSLSHKKTTRPSQCLTGLKRPSPGLSLRSFGRRCASGTLPLSTRFVCTRRLLRAPFGDTGARPS